MSLLPIFLKLEERQCLLVGAGTVALEKIGSLLKTGARLRVVAPKARAEIQELAAEGKLEWLRRAFEPADLDGNFIVIAATDVPEVNAAVYREAMARGIPCNSVDDIPNCDFFFGSVVSRGDLRIAISTAGESPAVAQRLRREIDEQLPRDLGPWLAKLGEMRREVLATHPRGEERRLLLHELASRQICDSALCAAKQLARTGREAARPIAGSVYLVGAGPGDPDLTDGEGGAADRERRCNSARRSGAADDPRIGNALRRSGERRQALRREDHHAGGDQRVDGRSTRAPAEAWCGSRAAIRCFSGAPLKNWQRLPRLVCRLRLCPASRRHLPPRRRLAVLLPIAIGPRM